MWRSDLTKEVVERSAYDRCVHWCQAREMKQTPLVKFDGLYSQRNFRSLGKNPNLIEENAINRTTQQPNMKKGEVDWNWIIHQRTGQRGLRSPTVDPNTRAGNPSGQRV